MGSRVDMNVLVLCVAAVVWMHLQRPVKGSGSDREAAVRDLFREMLHIKPPPPRAPKAPGGPPRPQAAPRHMLDLYQQYTSRQPPDTATTTIRNILPSGSAGTVGKDVLVFNVSSVQGREDVRLAQLQLNRRRLHQRHHHSRRLLAPPYRVRLFRVTPSRLAGLASVPVSMVPRSAWAAVDVTSALRELLLDPRPSRHLLAVRFESPSGKPIPPAHFLRGVPDTPHAFLVVFSEDSDEDEVSEDGTESSPRPAVHSHALVQKLQGQHGDLFREEEDEVDNSPQIIPLLREDTKGRRVYTKNNTLITTKQSIPPTQSTDFDNSDPNRRLTSGESVSRKTRSIIDNQLPDDDDMVEPALPKSSPESVLTARTDLLQFPDGPGRKPRKGKKAKRKRGKKQKFLPSLDAWQNAYRGPEEGASGASGGCTVRRMTVNFAEIGWGEWIISPDKFDANYCTGSCRFPLTKAVKPSNHATLQSLMHALGHNPLVPAPACVPHHMSAITLLYYDETLNVVLKNYPSMIVDSCACR